MKNILNKIYLGDCQILLPHILEKLDRNKVILISDPPFNIGYKYNEYKDNLDEEEYFEVLETIFGEDKCILIHYPEQLYKFSFKIGKFPNKVVSWVYNSNNYKQHRDIAFFGIEPDFTKVKQPYKNPSDKRIKERMLKGSGGGRLYDWWEIQQVKNVSTQKYNHPCQMPIEVMENIIGILPNDVIIIDPFMGTGTTCLAVKNMNEKQNVDRKYIGIEIDNKYFEIARDRLNGISPTGQTSIFTDFKI
jgi:DNA modification methylase